MANTKRTEVLETFDKLSDGLRKEIDQSVSLGFGPARFSRRQVDALEK